ncbi:threonylcarbamoyl-AMP synthase [Candidatus Giovannonibacteria bacterium]|nr:threonylcarbamoyl-AMP synthase [Candidatus Giovannonibacteria bacterium]
MRILKLSREKFDSLIDEASNFLNKGGVIIIPTDTVYGFAADATNSEAVAKIFKIKQRPEEKSFPVFVGSIDAAEKIAVINAPQIKFLKKIWPGKVTCVFNVKQKLAAGTFFGNTVAIRIPDNGFVLKLLLRLGKPLAQSSANISGKSDSLKIADIIKEFEKRENKPDLIIDSGDLADSLPSTIVDLTGDEPKILREGAVSKAAIFALY